MSTSLLSSVLRYELPALIGGLALLTFFLMWRGKISTRRLLAEKDGSAPMSLGRLQMLMLSVAVAFYFLLQVIDHPERFPEIPQELLALLGGSNALYLGSKSYSLLYRPENAPGAPGKGK
ncbi:MAG TPA: hypothetical protein VK447_03840 [Myxococcaceae bacterium]|nr:hypothetical protein [Myxococcaceae bacterium]